MIYFDNAAGALHRPPCVVQAVAQAMETFGAAGRGAHAPALAASRTIYRCREQAARLFGCLPERVCFTAGATEALNTAIAGLFGAGDHVITTAAEHNSVLRPLYRSGAEITVLPLDGRGRIWLEGLAAALRGNTRGVICTHASNVTGNVTDIHEIGAFCRENGLYFVLDAAQTAGLFDIDMQALGISALCFTGHKSLLGPQGTGGLCLSLDTDIPPFKVGGSGIHSFEKEMPAALPDAIEAGTANAHGLAGLSAALGWLEGQDRNALRQRAQRFARRFYEGVRGLDGVQVYGDWETENRAPIVSLNIGGEDAGAAADALYTSYEICTRAGAHCAPLVHEHFGTVQQGMVRFSFSHSNTEEEVDTAIAALRSLVGGE